MQEAAYAHPRFPVLSLLPTIPSTEVSTVFQTIVRHAWYKSMQRTLLMGCRGQAFYFLRSKHIFNDAAETVAN